MVEIAAAELKTEPYRHFYCENVFSPQVYQTILESLPEDEQMQQYRAYPDRMDCAVDLPELERLFDVPFRDLLLQKFGAVGTQTELRFVRDRKGYAIPPHTDKVKKVISLLFYLPVDDSLKDYGTSIYVPKSMGFADPYARHHRFEDFEKVYTAPFLPNSCFGFMRSDTSFHGVEPIGDVVRNTLLYNIYK